MIDFHSHILPQSDDGARSVDESIALARMYVDAGFTHVTATPHCLPGTHQVPDAQDILDKIDSLNTILKDQNIPLTVLQGMEIGIDPDLLILIQQRRILSLGGSNTLLIETPFQRLPRGWEQFMVKLKEAGYKILMGHPERSAQVIKNSKICRRFIDLGLYLQVTWDSLLGNNGPDAQRLAGDMISKGYAHVMATDSHRVHWRNPGNVKEGLEYLKTQIGMDNAALLCTENPRRILKNLAPKPIKRSDVSRMIQKTSKWQRLLKKLV